MAGAAANDAEYYAQGYRLGQGQADRADEEEQRKIAQQREAQQFQLKQQQAQAEQAQQGQELQLRQKALEASATQSAQKYQAQQAYQQAIAAGMDPTQAILKFGPMMGAGNAVPGALKASIAANRPPPAPPKISMLAGPNGQQVPALVQGTGRASVIPQSVLNPRAPAQPDQWKDTTRKINGREVPGQESTKTGRFVPYPAGEQEGAVSPQTRLQVATVKRKKAQLEKTLNDESALLALAKKKAGAKAPTHDDLEAVQADVQKQIDAYDEQVDKLTSGAGGEKAAPADEAPKKTFKFTRDKDGNLVMDTSNANPS
jgi:hypothetical protein